MQAVNPAMHDHGLAPLPGILDDGGLANMRDLLDDIELAQPVVALLMIVNRLQPLFVPFGDIADMPQPVVGDANPQIVERRTDTAAAVVTDDHDEIGRATSELQSLMRISYAVFCLKKNNIQYNEATQYT